MEAKTNNMMVGVIVIILTIALLITTLWLSVGFGQKKYNTYAVYLHEAVSGLSDQAPVKYNGVQVGNVSKIELSHSDPQEVKILLSILDGTPITTSTTATLVSQGITGTAYLGLSANSSDLTPLKKLPNEPYPIIPTKPSLFVQIDSVLKEVSDNINSVASRLKDVLNTDNTTNLKKSLANIETFTAVVANHQHDISRTLANTDLFLRNMTEVSRELPGAIEDLKTGISQLTNAVSSASNSISTTMDAGKTTLDKISQQTIPPVLILLRHLNNVAINFEKVSEQLRQNPAVILRGSSPPKPGPGE